MNKYIKAMESGYFVQISKLGYETSVFWFNTWANTIHCFNYEMGGALNRPDLTVETLQTHLEKLEREQFTIKVFDITSKNIPGLLNY